MLTNGMKERKPNDVGRMNAYRRSTLGFRESWGTCNDRYIPTHGSRLSFKDTITINSLHFSETTLCHFCISSTHMDELFVASLGFKLSVKIQGWWW